ncbi:MAG: hypothetical protein HYV95_16905 [Opitutae bacterium]|nr:hypothetical protein [Opitutae bacterium]
MKVLNFIPAALVAAALSASSLFAQEAAAPSPAPVAVDHVIYLAKLPTPAELMKGAETQHATIERIDQTSAQITVTYQYSSGRKVTFAYTLLSAVAADVPVLTSTAPVVSAPAPSPDVTVVAPPPTTTVVYTTPPPPVYYYERPVRYYDPAWDWVAPLAVGVSLGWVWHGGHHYDRAYHGHGWRGGHHGGWRRH